jgi:hypothetical protein
MEIRLIVDEKTMECNYSLIFLKIARGIIRDSSRVAVGFLWIGLLSHSTDSKSLLDAKSPKGFSLIGWSLEKGDILL